jgi:uncharacterized membrane protein
VSSLYWALLVAHIVSVVVAFGSLLTLPLITRSLASATPTAEYLAWTRQVPKIRAVISERALPLIGVFGVGLTLTHPDKTLWHQLWWRLAVGFYVVALVAILGIQRWALATVARFSAILLGAATTNGPDVEQQTLTQTQAAQLRRAGIIAELVSATSAIGLVVMVFLMVVRPT